MWASNIVYQREIWSLPTGAVDTIFHGQSRITGKIARKNDKNKSLSLKLKYFIIAGAHNLKLMCSATYCNMTTNTPCFSRLPIDLTWQPRFQHGTTPRFETGNDGGATAPWESWMELLQFCPKSSGYCYGDFRQAASLTFARRAG